MSSEEPVIAVVGLKYPPRIRVTADGIISMNATPLSAWHESFPIEYIPKQEVEDMFKELASALSTRFEEVAKRAVEAVIS
jgi:hypothetical protein